MKVKMKDGIYEAIQWFIPGDHPMVKRDPKEEAPNLVCPTCDHPMREHGIIPTNDSRYMICPGDYVVTGEKEIYVYDSLEQLNKEWEEDIGLQEEINVLFDIVKQLALRINELGGTD